MRRSRCSGARATSRPTPTVRPTPTTDPTSWSVHARRRRNNRTGRSLELRPDLLCGARHCDKLVERLLAWQVLHPAVRGENQPFGIDEPQRIPDPRDHGLDILDLALVRQVDHTDDQSLVT